MFDIINECQCCGGSKLKEILDLGNQPPANSYHKEGEIIPEYPLVLNLCTTCFHSQLSVAVEPDELFKHYLYVSGTSDTIREYFDWFAKMTVDRSGLTVGRVLEVASNDGTQLDSYASLGWDTYGIDPAENLSLISKGKGHKIVVDYMTKSAATSFGEKFDIIVAQNVFAHTRDLISFLRACKSVMYDNTRLYIQTSQANMFMNNEFDTNYHEHIHQFNTNSMDVVCHRAGLYLNRVIKTPIHGTSYLFEIHLHPGHGNVVETINQEFDQGLYNIKTYDEFSRKATTCVMNLKHEVEMQKNSGHIVIGAGAAAKGMTVLNFGKISLDFIVDENPLKQGLTTPGMNIPIVSFDILKGIESSRIYIVPLAWNFYSEIKEKIKKIRPNSDDRFVRYFPELTMEP